MLLKTFSLGAYGHIYIWYIPWSRIPRSGDRDSCLPLVNKAKQFSKTVVPIYTPTSSECVPIASCPHHHLTSSAVFIFAFPLGMCDFCLIFPCKISCIYWPLGYNLFKPLAYISSLLFLFFLIYGSSLYTLNISPLQAL